MRHTVTNSSGGGLGFVRWGELSQCVGGWVCGWVGKGSGGIVGVLNNNQGLMTSNMGGVALIIDGDHVVEQIEKLRCLLSVLHSYPRWLYSHVT